MRSHFWATLFPLAPFWLSEVKIFDPTGLPLVDESSQEHPKVLELRELSLWSEAHVWCSRERHGAMTGVMKTQIDWLLLAPIGGVRRRREERLH